MLDKSPSSINITKLRAILLFKADFNAINKVIVNYRLSPQSNNSKISLKKLLLVDKANHLFIQL